MGSGAKSYMRKGSLMYEEIRKYLPYMRKIWFCFIRVHSFKDSAKSTVKFFGLDSFYKFLTSNVTQKILSASTFNKTIFYQCIGVCIHIEYSKLLGSIWCGCSQNFYGRTTGCTERVRMVLLETHTERRWSQFLPLIIDFSQQNLLYVLQGRQKKEGNKKMKSYEVRRNKIPEVMRSFENSKNFAKVMSEEVMRSRGQLKRTCSRRTSGQDEGIYFVRSWGHEERICFLEVLISGDDEKLLGIMRLVMKDILLGVLGLRSVEGKSTLYLVSGHRKRKCRLAWGPINPGLMRYSVDY